MTEIRFLTLIQPWASLLGVYKAFETRSWSTNYRGPLAICAGKNTQHRQNYAHLRSYRARLRSLPGFDDLPFGAVVSVVNLSACKKMVFGFPDDDEIMVGEQSDLELELGHWDEGRFAWQCDRELILPEPIPIVGKQGLFRHVEIADQLQSMLRSQGVA